MKTEKELLLEIKKAVEDLHYISSSSNYVNAVDKISAKVEDLCDNYSPNYFDSLELEHFRHTINTEVSYVENAKSKTKAESFMAKATKQLKVDLFSILEKANDIE